MFAVNTYEEIEKREREASDKHIVVLLFVRPSLAGAQAVIEEFSYLHYNSEKYCSIYAVGYSNHFNSENNPDYIKVCNIFGENWYFSVKEFVNFKNNLENRIKWEYSGEMEIIVLQNKPDSVNSLNFQNYVAIDVNYGIKNGYIDSFPRFMEALIRTSKSEVMAENAIKQIGNKRIKLKEFICDVIGECKKIPKPVAKIVKDRLFYRGTIRKNNLNLHIDNQPDNC